MSDEVNTVQGELPEGDNTTPLETAPPAEDPLAAERAELAREREELRQQITDLASNYTPEMKRLIELQKQGKSVHISDAPSQPQVPQAQAPNAFEEFQGILGEGFEGQHASVLRRGMEHLTQRIASAVDQQIESKLKPLAEQFESVKGNVGNLAHHQSLEKFFLDDVDIGGGVKSSALRNHAGAFLREATKGGYGPNVPWSNIARSALWEKVIDKGKAAFEESQQFAQNANLPQGRAPRPADDRAPMPKLQPGQKRYDPEHFIRHRANSFGVADRIFGRGE